jgi:hypothetical protein
MATHWIKVIKGLSYLYYNLCLGGIMHKKLAAIVVGIAVFMSPVIARALAVNTTLYLYVSPNGKDSEDGSNGNPFQTIARAQAQVRTLRANAVGDITVYLRGGTYQLSQPLTFGPNDGGLDGHLVTYASYPGETAVLSGGTVMTGWRATNDRGISYLQTGLQFRQLYTDIDTEARPQKARVPAHPIITGKGASVYSFVPGDCSATGNKARKYSVSTITLPAASNLFTPHQYQSLPGSEMVILKYWDQSRLPVTSAVTTANAIVVTPESTAAHLEGCNYEIVTTGLVTMRVYFENSPQFIVSPSDWALRNGYLYLIPQSSSDLSGHVIAPQLETILQVNGAQNLTFDRLEFRYTTWNYPTANGYVGGQDGYSNFCIGTIPCKIPGGIQIANARDVTITRSMIADMGGSGIEIDPGTSRITLSQNHVFNISGNGIEISTNNPSDPSNPMYISSNDTISNNTIEHVALDYDGAGIIAGYLTNSLIDHNTLRYLNHSGIALGWFGQQNLPVANTTVSGNDISRVTQLYDDGAGIYMLPGTKGYVVSNNYIHDFPYSGAGHYLHAGIYLDQLTSNVNVHDNQLTNLTDGLYLQTQNAAAGDYRAHDNVLANISLQNITNPMVTPTAVAAAAAAVHNSIQYVSGSRRDIISAAGASRSGQ